VEECRTKADLLVVVVYVEKIYYKRLQPTNGFATTVSMK